MSKNPGAVRGRILVVDDDPVMRALPRRVLQAAGYLVDIAEDGASAFRLATERGYDLVVTDLDMPGLDGFGLLSLVRSQTSTGAIVMTGSHSGDVGSVKRAFDLGAVGYVAKGQDFAEDLIAKVRQALGLRKHRLARQQSMI
jgi:two-component system, chemotaxis family, sensor kinase CheA